MINRCQAKKQALSVARSANYHLATIGRIRKFIDCDTTKTLINSFVTSRLDYCNSLLSGSSAISHLQRIQNKAARIISLTKPTEHITPVIQLLHWLPITKRIIFKQLLLTYSALFIDSSPRYLKELLTVYQPQRTLRSSNQSLLTVPSTRTKLADNAFSAFAPRLWNSLPPHIKPADSVHAFKKLLKTFLFNQ